jgi:leucyl-tRNA synthetase
MQRYNPKEIEPKWQLQWEADKIYHATEDPTKPKKYILEYFPYPSGAAMHVGHVRNYTIGDAIARYNRMNGYNVLHPMGWDAFGLPAENYAIKNKVSPRQAIDENTTRFKQQLIQMGFGYDWSREIDSSDPDYYRWTQWFFLLLFKRGLAYQKESLQWWCPHDKTVLANEQVENGVCWRCGHQVEKKALKQWFFKITDYADRLTKDLDTVNWTDSIKNMQRNWIGRSEGVVYKNAVRDTDLTIESFSAHFEAFTANTFVVIAPDHPFLPTLLEGVENKDKILADAKEMALRRDVEGPKGLENVEGIFTERYAVDVFGDEDLPIWIANYALADYGTGIVLCSAHDDRDFMFAKKYGLRLKPTMVPTDPVEAEKVKNLEYAFTDMKNGVLIEPVAFAGKVAGSNRQEIIDYMAHEKYATPKVSYKIRDWLISRQRYWGAPIPIIHCEKDGAVAVPEDQLPVQLPAIESYEPGGDGRSPLANVPEFVNTTCPTCGGPAKRETDTMDGFACSSWYFLRFADPHNTQKPFDADKAKFWLPVDDYIGGAEHAVMHLLYARMWTKVMFDEGLIDFNEPFKTLRNHGMILAPDGNKMSKSKGNTIEPGGLIDQGYGADSIRIMELFIGPWNQMANWSVEGMGGSYRFLQRIWTLVKEYQAAQAELGVQLSTGADNDAILKITHRTIKKVGDDMQSLSFNTAVAAQMEMVNILYKIKASEGYGAEAWRLAVESLIQLVAPFAPHISEELWQQIGNEGSVHLSSWPVYDEVYLVQDTVIVAVQVNGKLRAQLEVAVDTEQAAIESTAKADTNVASYIDGKDIVKTIYVPGKIVNFVVR